MVHLATFAVRRNDLRRTRFFEQELALGEPDDVALRVDGFALTANNITYARLGDSPGYWRFFPVADPEYGCIPAWGFATVVRSSVAGLAEGDRFFGYVPLATHLVVQPERIRDSDFRDGAAHRPRFAPVYNTYTRPSSDPLYAPGRDAAHVIFRPLFTTSFVLADFLTEHELFGAKQLVISSASSKTAYGTAFLLADSGVPVVGATSEKNKGFVAGLGCYERTLGYEEIADLDPNAPTLFVDVAGDPAIRAELYRHLGKNVSYECRVGSTHWPPASPADAPEAPPAPAFFMAADQIAKRSAEWGAAGFQTKLAASYEKFLSRAMDPEKPWIRVVSGTGNDALLAVYDALVTGNAEPDQGHVLAL